MKYIKTEEIERRMDWVRASPASRGRVALIVVRPQSNQRESPERAMLSPEGGVAGDNWRQHCWKKSTSGEPHPDVQVAIMNARMIELLAGDKAHWPPAGDQLFVDFDLSVENLCVGDQLEIGAAMLEITAEPHRGCKKFKQRFGEAALRWVNSAEGDAQRLRGVYAKIVLAGEVEVGDVICKR
jgi:MOSC domain